MRLLKTRDKLNKFGIPWGYTRVEYIQSTGTQYIDTGVLPVNDMEFECKFTFTSLVSSNLTIVGSRDGEKRCQPIGAYNNRWSASIGGAYDANGTSVSANTPYIIKSTITNGQTITTNVNGSQASTCTNTTGLPSQELYIFARNFYGNTDPVDSKVNGKLNFLRIKANGVLVRDFIPCIDPLGVACMYDLVGKKPYYNQGTGEFTYGRQIIPVEYLESSGTQYIDAGFIPTENTRTVARLFTTSTANKNWFGANGESQVAKGCYCFNAFSATLVEYLFGNVRWARADAAVVNKVFTVDFSKNGIYIDDELVATPSYTDFGTGDRTMTLFVRNGGTAYISGRIYCLKMYDNGVLVRDYIPCKDENGVGFMFDTVESKVYLNNGTGSFIVGEEAYDYKDTVRFLKDKIKYGLLSEYTRVEYIEATNAGDDLQYAVGNYRLTDTTDWEITFSASAPSNNWVLGQPSWIGVHYRKDATTSNLPRVGITNGSTAAYQCYVDYTDNEKITLALKGTDVYANGVKVGSITRVSAGATQTKYGIFVYKDINQALPNLRIRNAKIYEIKIWDNNVLVQHLLPVIDSNGEGCFYDMVNKTVIRKEDNCTSDFTTGNMVYGLRLLAGGSMDDYIFLDYLESTGTQYIDTGIYPAQLTKAQIDMQFTSITKCSVLGSNNGASQDAEWNNLFGSNITGQITDRFWCQWGLNFGGNFTKDLNRHTHIFERNENTSWTYTVDTTSFTNSSGISTQPTNNQRVLYLFACNNNGTLYRQSYAKIYNCKIWDNNTLIRNFLPALRKSDSKPGMYDMVEGKFYVNQNTGADFNYGYKQ